MNKTALLIAFLMPLTAVAQNDDFGMDFSAGAEKKICRGVDISIDGNVRTQDNTSTIERWNIGASLGVKLINTKKFDVKATAGWEFIWQNNMEEHKDHYEEEEYYTPDGVITDRYYDGYNLTDNYWRPRHRTTFSLTGTYHPNKRWTLALKESVQYNHYCHTTKDVYKYRLADEDDPESIFLKGNQAETKDVKAKDRTLLRSRLTVQYDIRHSNFAPYASVDYGCGLNYTTNKWKFTVGTDIKINKRNKFDIFYRFQHENDDDEPNGHLIGLGYSIKL